MATTYTGTKVLSIGGSRNIGYFSAVRLLEKGARVTFLLRSPSAFDADSTIQKYVTSGKARLIKGDALVKDDVKKGWVEAAKGQGDEKVDVLLFTVGGTPKFELTKGFTISPANLVTQSLLNVLSTLPPYHPKIITLSSTGLSKKSHANLPFALKPLYGYLLAVPHKDKVGAERIVAHCAGWPWDAEDGEVGEDILGSGWEEGLPEAESLKSIVVIRPALLVDGDCKADKVKAEEGKEPYRVKEGEIGGWTVGRKDVAHFVVEGVLGDWGKWEGKCISIAY